jgi:ATP-dependent Lhr-like helicase
MPSGASLPPKVRNIRNPIHSDFRDSHSRTMNFFHPLIIRWFLERFGKPTDLQEKAWPAIAAGEHVLLCAPTGSGKTLAAFLWSINQLLTGKWEPERTRVLYVSPLKALNYDIQRNLTGPLIELKRVFEQEGEFFPPIRVLTRSGDTPAADRRRMQRHPPEILITTPESLNLLLSSPVSRNILTDVLTAILDEIHAVVGTKRGVHLITAVDRLVLMAGEFQRIALSATLRPVETVAEFVGGGRPVHIVESSLRKKYAIRVRSPETAPASGDSFWDPFAREVKEIIRRNRSTLIFTNSRRLCEKITRLINVGEEKLIAYAHHGSLSREIRVEVEQKLKAGELKAIVATNSLELGIDIGPLDEVVLIQSPPSLSSAIQRIGRAGHRVAEVSRATLFPTHPQDFVEAAVVASGVIDHDIEELRPPESPLDVLAQIIVSMAGTDPWDKDRLFEHLRSSYPYRKLPRLHFDLVLNMLAGRYASTRIRELEPRVSIDGLDNTVTARKGAIQALYSSGGTIPDRGYFHLRHDETHAKIGELDEEFVWEATPGQVFTLGTQSWSIKHITHNDVFVMPAGAGSTAPPFWRAEESLRDFHLSERMGEFLERANDQLADSEYQRQLIEDHCMEQSASAQLIQFLNKQKETTGCPLPHRHHLLLEWVGTGPGGYPGNQLVLHTIWGGRVNRPFALALEAAWESRFGQPLEVYPSDDCVMLQLPREARSRDVLSLVTSANALNLLKKKVESSGFFGARFRECAGRALLLTRRRMNERMPLWLSRLRSQKLLDAVLAYKDFPLLLEAWRTCLNHEFDVQALLRVLGELESGTITWSETHTSFPSPMARSVTWPQINQYMYMEDRGRSGKTSGLARDLLQDVLFTPGLRPDVCAEHVADFERKRMRLAGGYAPDTPQDLLDWVKERVLIPVSEWKSLLDAVKRDHDLDEESLVAPIARRLARLHPPSAAEPLLTPLDSLPEVLSAFYAPGDKVRVESFPEGSPVPAQRLDAGENPEELLTSLLSTWFSFYGPLTPSFVRATLGIDVDRLERAVEDLADSEKIVAGRLIRDSEEDYWCDTENFGILLRLARAEARPSFEALDIQKLQLFLAQHQGIADRGSGRHLHLLYGRLEQLAGYPAPAQMWEADILPARLKSYEPAWLDSLMQESDLAWLGSDLGRICFYLRDDLDLVLEEDHHREGGTETGIDSLFPDPKAKYDFSTLLRVSGLRPSELAGKLWDGVWQGRIRNDTFSALRRGIETKFNVAPVAAEGSPRRPRTWTFFDRWKTTVPFAGNWQKIERPVFEEDPVEAEERNKDRARLLLDRYGILFRELLLNESPAFRWPALFRALRLMELSGEVLTGYFFRGISGRQFISHQAFRSLQTMSGEERVYWISSMDPASLCGIPLGPLKGNLPRRAPGTHLVYRGSMLALVSQKKGRRLDFHLSPDDPGLPSCFEFLHAMMTRKVQPLRRIVVERINGEPAGGSPYLEAFRAEFDVSVDYRKVTLYPRRS